MHASSHFTPPLTQFLVSCPSHTSILKYPASICFCTSLHQVPSLQACMCLPTPETTQGIQCYQVACRSSLVPAVVCKISVVHPTALGLPAARKHTQPHQKKKGKKRTPFPVPPEGCVQVLVVLCQLYAMLMPYNSGDGACCGRWQLGTSQAFK